MFTLREPSDDNIARFLLDQSNLPFSYAEVGATRLWSDPSVAPHGFTVDHNRIQLGRGTEVFQRAIDALKHWRQFELGWVSIAPRGVKLEKGATVAVKAWACGMWSLNACRVVYVVDEAEPGAGATRVERDEAEPITRFGLAYGTLPDHVERGEERFLIEWDRKDDSVWYDILAFSQPRHPLVKLGSPVARVMQKRFARASLAAMKSAVIHP
jgi:uncharacterized protein (UPF0548 family)